MPPKKSGKAAKNGFYFFMVELKQRQGRNFKSMAEAAEAAGPIWSNMSARDKEPYEIMARREKNNLRDIKYTTLGNSIAQVEKEENEMKRREEKIRMDTQNIIHVLVQTNKVATHYFYIAHINTFCYSNVHKRHYPAEIAVARFNLLDGVCTEKVFHRIIEPGPLPLGYSFEAKRNSEETHQLPIPSGQQAPDNTEQVFNDLVAFLLETSSDSHEIPPLYTREKDLAVLFTTLEAFVLDFGTPETEFDVFSLEYLLYVLKNAVAEKQVWPAISLSSGEIERDVYDFTLNIACDYHESIDVPVYCSKAIVIRMAYIVCDNCCKYLEINLIPGRHVPTRAKLPTSSRPNTSCAPSEMDDKESLCGFKSVASALSDDESSPLSFYSAEPTFGADDFPTLGGNKKSNSDSDSAAGGDWRPVSKRGNKRSSKKPVELPSALASKMEGLNIKDERKPKGRGRGIVKKPANT